MERQQESGIGRERMRANLVVTEFVVDGKGIPEVDFDIGESYAGLLPISSSADKTRKLYFWCVG